MSRNICRYCRFAESPAGGSIDRLEDDDVVICNWEPPVPLPDSWRYVRREVTTVDAGHEGCPAHEPREDLPLLVQYDVSGRCFMSEDGSYLLRREYGYDEDNEWMENVWVLRDNRRYIIDRDDIDPVDLAERNGLAL